MPELKEQRGCEEAERRIEDARRSHRTGLVLAYLELRTLPESLGQLFHLEYLSLSNNNFTTLPEPVRKLPNLRSLNLNSNLITVLPEWLGELAELKEIRVDNNQLVVLPESLGKLAKMTHLFMNDNRLIALPQSLGQLIKLEKLHINNNQLTVLPESLGQLTNLTTVSVKQNQLSSIPNSLAALPKLTHFYLERNPELGIPDEILNPAWRDSSGSVQRPPKTPKEILEYYFTKLAGSRPLNEAKLILVGQGGVGKTSLVNTIKRHKFKKGEEATEGIKINDWQCALNQKQKITVHIWDFGGQEMMHATHQFFLTARTLYLLVLNRRRGGIDREADYWFRLVRAFGGKDAPVIVALNKQQSEPFDVNRGGWLEKYSSNIKGFVKTDCEDAESIEQLQKKIRIELAAMEGLKASFPERWFTIKDELSQMKDQYVTYDQYRAICKKHGEEDADKQALLAGFLHDLGIALSYKDDPRLRFAYVLKPEWVTEGIYALLHAFVKNKGLFTHAEAEKVLAPKGYKAEAADFIMGLMEQFEVSFPLGDHQRRSLIPQLLDDQQPDEAREFKPTECLNFGYKYEIVPEGLLPRFIVRTHHISEERGRWKSGVILHDPDTKCHALVRADSAAGLVSINVDGPKEARRDLLAIIRYNFRVIHGDYEFKPVELVYPPGIPESPQRLDHLEAFVKNDASVRVPISLPDETVITPTAASLIEPVKDSTEPVRLFLSYAHEDGGYVEELRKALKPAERNGLIQYWYDGAITAGEAWRPLIEQRLRNADIVVCQLSRDFLNSDFCMLEELKTAVQRKRSGKAELVAYVLHKCDWEETEIAQFQILPKEAKPIDRWRDKHEFWKEIGDGIKKAANKLRQHGLGDHREKASAG